jgi:hypothetical protein
MFAVAIALAAIGGALVLLTIDAAVPDYWGFRGYWDLLTPIVGIPGLLVALRQPRNPIGWLLLVAAISLGFGGAAQEYATYGVIVRPGSLPGVVPVAWVTSWSFSLFAAQMVIFIPSLFPSGRLLSPRWRPLIWAGAAFVLVVVLAFGLRPGPLENAPFVDNPLALTGALADLRLAVITPLEVLIAVAIIAAAASLVVRFQRSTGVEREQLKWVALSGVFIVLSMIWILFTTPAAGPNTTKPAQVLMIIAFATLPVTIGIAILRYRLYDVDLIINRALVYGVLSAVLAATYFALVVVFQAILRPLTGGSEIAVAASTLGTIALSQPVRHRIQRAVDHRFYRARYDAQQIVDTFTARLRDEVDLDDVRAQLLGAVHATVQPRGASVWLREQAP